MEIDSDRSGTRVSPDNTRYQRGIIVPVKTQDAPSVILPSKPPINQSSASKPATIPPRVSMKNVSNQRHVPFPFQISDIESGENLRVRFFDAHMTPYEYSMSSGEEGFSRPFAKHKNAQSVEAPSENYSFSDLFLDVRYSFLGTEDGKTPPNIEAIIEKLKMFMQPNLRRMRKPRLSILYGAKIIGTPGESYLYMNSLGVRSDQSDDEGRYVSANLSMSFTLYYNQ